MFGFLFALISFGVLWLVLHLLGYRLVRQDARSRAKRDLPGAASQNVSGSSLSSYSRSILINALSRSPFTDELLPEQRDSLRRWLMAGVQPEVTAAPQIVPALQGVAAQPTPRVKRSSSQSMVETVRASWDPAVMLLYLGALLVVIAGLIFASYSWGTWGGWQKLGMLIGATAAFLVAGFGLQRFERIRPAARTFVTIGGLLVPANALAAYTIFHAADPLLILLAGASVTALIHGILSAQPESIMFRYSSVAAFILAIASLPGAMGQKAAWGCVLSLALIAIPPDPWGRLERFARAWAFIGSASILPLAGIGVLGNQGEKHWLLPALLVALSISLNRVGQRAPNLHIGLNIIADTVLVIANITAAWVLTGDQWLISSILLSVGLILIRYSQAYPERAPALETFAAFPLAGFLGIATDQISTADRGVTVFFATLTLAMLLMAYRWPKSAAITQGVAVFALPATFLPMLDPLWDMAVFSTLLTVTLILWRRRWNTLGDVPIALASFTAITAVFVWGNALDIESNIAWTWIIAATAVIGTAVAEVLPPPVLAKWVRNLIRLQGVALFTFAFAVEAKYAVVLVIAMLAMGWNVWANRHGFWALPGVLFMGELFARFVVLEDVSPYWAYLWEATPILLMGALAWQLDRRTAPSQRPAGLYVWALVVVASAMLSQQWDVQGVAHLIGIPVGLMAIAAVHAVALGSTRMWIFLLPAFIYIINANSLLLQPAVRDTDHAIIAIGFTAAAVLLLWRTTLRRSRFAFALLALAVLHLNAVFDQPAVPGVLIGVVTAWLLLSLGLARGRVEPAGWHLREAALQASLMHVVALIGPFYGTADDVFSRSALVLGLISLAGTIAVYGATVRSRMHLFLASAFAMAALMLQINAGQPGNVHVYTVPLAVYLLGVGLLFRNHPRTANALLAAGSGVLVIPAMLEALTTGSLIWLWVALAESLALFLMGSVLQLRIPTAAAVIAVSVIALRMLVMAINVYASWISMLAIGVTLLLLGTLWLIYREAIQQRLHVVFTRWLAFH